MSTIPEIEIKYYPKVKPGSLPKIRVSFQAFELFLESWDSGLIDYLEQVKAMFLNKDNRVLGIYTASTGGFSDAVLDPRPIFIAAVMSCATSIILAHNHPSGDYKPSPQDVLLTRKMVKAGKLLNIRVIDHMIITSDFYSSMRDDRIIRSR